MKYNIEEREREENGTRKDEKNEVSCKSSKNLNNDFYKKMFFENKYESIWISTKSASAILGISPNALRIRKHRGLIEYRYFGKYLRFNINYLSTLFREERQVNKE